MIARAFRKQAVLKSLVRGGGGHWDRPDVPLNVRWTPERHYQINDLNTWFYDGSMPEYMLGNHELLIIGGDSLKDIVGHQLKMLKGLSVIVGCVAFTLYFMTTFHLNLGYFNPTNPKDTLQKELQKDKLGLRKDFMGTDLTGEHGNLHFDYTKSNTPNDKTYRDNQNSEKIIAEARSWWAKEQLQLDGEVKRRIQSGQIGGHH